VKIGDLHRVPQPSAHGQDDLDQGRLGGYQELGISRVQALVRASVSDDDAIELLAADARAAGLSMAGG
jgi:hypothetical protein